MARFTTVIDVQAPAPTTWRVLTDWPRHTDWVPLTRMRVLTQDAHGVGARFVARTAVGPLGFDDVMEITTWQPPTATASGRCEIVKHGRAVRGSVQFEVAPAPGGSRVTWTQDIDVPPLALTRRVAPLVGAAARFAYTRTLKVMARDAERTAQQDAAAGSAGSTGTTGTTGAADRG